MFLAVVGQFRRPQIRRFTSTIQTVRKSSRTELCNPNFGPPPKFRLFASLRTTEPPKFSAPPTPFSTFRPFSGRADSDVPPNPDVSVLNAPFSPRNPFSSRFFGRKRALDPTFQRIPRLAPSRCASLRLAPSRCAPLRSAPSSHRH